MRNFLIIIILPLFLTTLFYWPLYEKIAISDSKTEKDGETKNFNFSFDEQLLGIFNINIPPVRHQLCLKNNNRVYLIHAIDTAFHTSDISREKIAKERKAGAMEIDLHYSNNFSSEKIYREIEQPLLCQDLISKKREYFASSTIFYHHIGMQESIELDTGNGGKKTLTRDIGNSYVDTSSSWAFIMPKRIYFIATWISLAILFGFNKIKRGTLFCWENLRKLLKKD